MLFYTPDCIASAINPNTTVWTILLQINPTSTMSLIGTVLVEYSMLLLLKNLTIKGQLLPTYCGSDIDRSGHGCWVRCYSDMCSSGICVPPKGYMFPPRRSDMRSPGICVPPPARASTGQTFASAGRDGSPRGRSRPSAHGRRGDESAPRMYIALVIATVHQYYHMYQYHGRHDATTQIASRAFPRAWLRPFELRVELLERV